MIVTALYLQADPIELQVNEGPNTSKTLGVVHERDWSVKSASTLQEHRTMTSDSTFHIQLL
jgi:hypothetical protein